MLSCLVCSESLTQKQKENVNFSRSKSKVLWRRDIFPSFCQLLGIPTDEIEDLAGDYDFEKEFPYCANCIHFPVMLSSRSESRDTLEAEILQMQISICSKLRKLEEVCDDVDEIVRQVRRAVDLNVGPTRRDFADLRRNKFRKLVVGSNFQKTRERILNPSIREPMIVPLSRNSSQSQLKEFEGRRPNFVIAPETVTCPMTDVKVEICDELNDGESWYGETSEAVEDTEVTHTNENEDIPNLPFCILPRGDKMEAGSSSLLPHPPNSILNPSDRKVNSNYDIGTPGGSGTAELRLSRGRKINYSDVANIHSSDEDSNSNNIDCTNDEDYTVDERNQTNSLFHIGDTSIQTFPRDDLVHSKLLGDLQSTDDGQLSFRSIPVTRTLEDIFRCGICEYECHPEGGPTMLDSIRNANFNIREHILMSHLGGYRCTVCDQHGMDSNELKAHMHYSHKTQEEKDAEIKAGINPPKEWRCHICGKRVCEKRSLIRHMETHRDKAEREKEKVPCKICSKNYFAQRMRLHMQQAHGAFAPQNGNFKCFNCEEKFSTLGLRNQHVRNVHSSIFKCDICDQVYQNYRALKNHKKIHTRIG